VKTTARRGKSLVDEVREVFADVVIAHVPVVKFDFRQKVTYLAVMLRRLMGAVMDPSQTDDRCATRPREAQLYIARYLQRQA
jgi:DNA-directed RNA polymerase III subunit RPC2